MVESGLLEYTVAVKDNLEGKPDISGVVISPVALSQEEIAKIQQMPLDKARAYCQEVLKGNFVVL